MTQSGHAARARSPFDKEACVGLHWEIDGFARWQQASRCPSAYS